jgi:hypothetical protein
MAASGKHSTEARGDLWEGCAPCLMSPSPH